LRENRRLTEEISLRKQLENDLRISQQRLIGILDSEEDAILCLDQSFKLVFFNQGAEQVFDYRASAIIQQKSNVIFPNPGFKEKIIEKASRNMKEFCQLLIKPRNMSPYMAEAYLSTVKVAQDSFFTIIIPDNQKKREQSTNDLDLSHSPQMNHEFTDIKDNLALQYHRMTALEEAVSGVYRLLSSKTNMPTLPDYSSDSEPKRRKLIVKLMNDALEYWEVATGAGKIELAEKSGLWHVRLEGGSYITRTLNRYLQLDQLPQKPRIRQVIQTVNYVLDYCSTLKDRKRNLENSLRELKEII